MNIGELVWRITGDTTGLTAAQKKADAAIGSTETKMKSFGATAQKVGGIMTQVGAGMTAAITLPLIGAGTAALKFAADFEVASRKFNKAFADSLPEANAALKELNESYGISEAQGTKLLAFTGDLLKGFGATSKQALDLSYSVQTLAASLSAYNGVPVDQASQAITSALLGEREAIKQLGVVISEEAVQQELLRTGQEKLTGQALLMAKAQATLKLAYDQSSDAVGSFADNTDSLSFQTAALLADLKDLGVSFGQILLPLAKDAVKVARDLADRFQNLSDEQKKGIVVIAGIAAAMGPLLVVLGQGLVLIGNIATALPAITTAATAASAALGTMGAALTAGGFVATAAVLGPIVAGIGAAAYLTLDYAQAQGELNGKLEAAQDIQEKYTDKINLSKEEMEGLIQSQERYFQMRQGDAQDAASFEKLVRDFAREKNIDYEVAVRLLEHSTALTKEQAEWAKELKREFIDVTQEIDNMNTGLATAAYYQALGTKEEKARAALLAESKAREAATQAERDKAALESYEKKIKYIDGEAEKRKTDQQILMEEIAMVEKWKFNQAKDEEKRMELLAAKRAELAELQRAEQEETAQKAKEAADKEREAYLSGLSPIARAYDEMMAKQAAAAANGEESFMKLTEAGMKGAADFTSSLGSLFSNINGFLQQGIGVLSDLVSSSIDERLNKNEAAMNKELEANGLLEETARERAARELEEAKANGDQETIIEKEKALKKIDIEEKYAKKKAKIEYEGALAKWGFDLASAIATAPLTIIQAMNTGFGAGWPLGVVLGPALAGVAAAATAVQIGALIANKPQAPKFATGGIVEPSPGGSLATVAENGSPELLLNSGDSGRPLLNEFSDAVAGRIGGRGGMMKLNIMLDGRVLTQTVTEYMNNGEYTIDLTRAARA